MSVVKDTHFEADTPRLLNLYKVMIVPRSI